MLLLLLSGDFSSFLSGHEFNFLSFVVFDRAAFRMEVLLWESMKKGLKRTKKNKEKTLYYTLCPDRVTYMSMAASTRAFLVTPLGDPQQN